MSQSIRKWIPFALCCAPGAVATLLVAGVAFGGAAFGLLLNSPLGLGLLGLAMLVCPVSMMLMLRGMRQDPESADAIACCAPQMVPRRSQTLVELRARRTSLEDEISKLESSRVLF